MAGYSKLDCGIIHSTVWQEPHDVRVAWITLLAITDANGYVRAAIPALAKLVDVPIPRMVEIMEHLCAPDEYSRSRDNDGRRLTEADGGWQILNYSKYREGLKQPDTTATARKRNERLRKKCHGSAVTNRDSRDSHAYAEAEAEAKADAEADGINTPPLPPKGASDADECPSFNRFWQEYPKKLGKGDALKAWKTGKCDQHIEEIMLSLQKHKRWHDWTKEGGRYIPHPATWLRRLGWENDLEVRGLETPGMAVGDSSGWD